MQAVLGFVDRDAVAGESITASAGLDVPAQRQAVR
jgi:hypothetical protein